MSTLYIIRHGQASFGRENYDQLSELGREQASCLGAFFRNQGIVLDRYYSGTMQRHMETAAAFLQTYQKEDDEPVDPVSLPAFNEYDAEAVLRSFIPMLIQEDKSFEKDVTRMFSSNRSFQKVFEKAVLRWIEGCDTPPDLISWKAYADQVNDGIKRIMQEHGNGRHIAVFSSGGPISAVVGKTLGIPGSITVRLGWQIINSSVTRFKFKTDRIMLMTFNEHAHLEQNGNPSWVTYR